MVDNQEASSKTMAGSVRAVRGIDWAAIFKRRPDLLPPGYEESVAEYLRRKQARLVQGEGKG